MGKRRSQPWIVSDELWSSIEPLLPEPAPKQVEGRPRVPDRQALCGILFVPHTGIQREYLPQEFDWSRAVIDSSPGFAGGTPTHVRAARRGSKADPARSTARDRAAGTTSSPTAGASRSRCH